MRAAGDEDVKTKGGGDGDRTGGKEGIRARGEFGRQYPRSRTRPTGPGEGIVARGGRASAKKVDNVAKRGN